MAALAQCRVAGQMHIMAQPSPACRATGHAAAASLPPPHASVQAMPLLVPERGAGARWGLGVLLYVLLTGRQPFSSPKTDDPMVVMRRIVDDNWNIKYPPYLSPAAKARARPHCTTDRATQTARQGCAGAPCLSRAALHKRVAVRQTHEQAGCGPGNA